MDREGGSKPRMLAEAPSWGSLGAGRAQIALPQGKEGKPKLWGHSSRSILTYRAPEPLRRKLLVLRSPKPRPGRGLRCTPLLTVQNPSTSRSTNGTCPKCDVTSRQIKKSRVSHSDSDFFHLRRPLELTLTSEVRDRSHTHTYTSKRVSHSHLTPWSSPCVSRHTSSAAQRKLGDAGRGSCPNVA